jgi:DNA-binding MarR family transcriptional regulator/DNA-directed RNA polymerase subunit RPC12/RpoP
MPTQHTGLSKPADELTDEDLELLWVVAQQPDATLGELGEAYGFPTPEPIREDLDELLEDVSDRDEVVPPLFENDVVEYEPSGLDEKTVGELETMRNGARAQSENGDEVDESDDTEDEIDARSMTEEEKARLVLEAVVEDPLRNKNEIGEDLDIGDQIAHKIIDKTDIDTTKPMEPQAREALEDLNAGELDLHPAESLTEKQRSILEAVAENPGAAQHEIAEEQGTTQGVVSSFFRDRDYYWRDRFEAVEDYLGIEVEPPGSEEDMDEQADKRGDDSADEVEDQEDAGEDEDVDEGDEEKEENCLHCGKEFIGMESRRAHEINCPEAEDSDETHVCEECGDEFDTERALNLHVTNKHETDYTQTHIEFLQAVLRYPDANQRELAEELDISRSGVEYRASAIREEYGEFDWKERHEVADEILDDLDEEIPEETEDTGRVYECPKCEREFDDASSLGSHERSCDGTPSERQRKILELVRDNPEAEQQEIADEIDVTPSSISYVFNKQLGYSWGERHEAVEKYLGEDEHEDEQDEPDDTPRVKNEDDYVDLTDECMSEHTEREATVPNDTLVDSVLRVDEDIVRRLRHTGAAVAEIDGEVVRLEVT